ncbi:MAG: hypothetical protein SPI18_06260 [Prevotella sp.]|nr:hypothetical protein [Prevotella sp.]MDY6130859.1 hypothetical protein [Prevotella sp.]
MKHPRLRDSNKLLTREPYPMNEIPEDLIVKIGSHLVYLLYIGRKDFNGNLIGKNTESGETKFTWQPHGSQFTIHTPIPANAVKFNIKQPPLLSKNDILDTIRFNESWVEIIQR